MFRGFSKHIPFKSMCFGFPELRPAQSACYFRYYGLTPILYTNLSHPFGLRAKHFLNLSSTFPPSGVALYRHQHNNNGLHYNLSSLMSSLRTFCTPLPSTVSILCTSATENTNTYFCKVCVLPIPRTSAHNCNCFLNSVIPYSSLLTRRTTNCPQWTLLYSLLLLPSCH